MTEIKWTEDEKLLKSLFPDEWGGRLYDSDAVLFIMKKAREDVIKLIEQYTIYNDFYADSDASKEKGEPNGVVMDSTDILNIKRKLGLI